jgi:hypothetical protein
MSTNTHLPVIHTLDVGSAGRPAEGSRSNNSKKISKTESFLSRLQLGSLQPIPLPGDVYYPRTNSSRLQPRPLGLIPDRNDRLAALKKLNQLFSSHSEGYLAYHHHHQGQYQPDVTDTDPPTAEAPTIAGAHLPSGDVSVPTMCQHTEYRLLQKGPPEPDAVNGDPDYMPIGERGSPYYTSVGPPPSGEPLWGTKHPAALTSVPRSLNPRSHEKKAVRMRR